MDKRSYLLGIFITSLFGTSLIITVGYVSQYIELIGYITQLVPLLIGLVIGVFFFTFAGSTISLKLNYGIVYGIVISVVFYVAVFEVIALSDYVISSSDLIVLSVLMSGGFMPVSTFVTDNLFSEKGIRFRSLFSILSGILSLVAILIVAIVYELSGQDTMTTEISLVGLLTILLLLVLYGQSAKKPSTGK